MADPVLIRIHLNIVRSHHALGMNATIYIYLLDEGTDVWRPVSAERVHDDIYRVTGTPPDGTETWEFATGDTVRCREQSLASGERRLVTYERVTHDAANHALQRLLTAAGPAGAGLPSARRVRPSQ